MKELWGGVENTLLSSLNPPATQTDIHKLEDLINAKLPDSFKQAYEIHNGQKILSKGIFGGKFFLSIDEIITEWMIWSKLQDDLFFDELDVNADMQIKAQWWNKKWIPFTNDGEGNHICIDLDPSKVGRYGQVIEIWNDDNKRKFICDDFGVWLRNIIT